MGSFRLHCGSPEPTQDMIVFQQCNSKRGTLKTSEQIRVTEREHVQAEDENSMQQNNPLKVECVADSLPDLTLNKTDNVRTTQL